MTLAEKLTIVMDAARGYYQTNRKLSLNDLIDLLKPMPNLLEGTDDFSGSQWTTKAGAVQSDQSFCGLACYSLPGKSNGAGVNDNREIKPGNYSFSFFLCGSAENTGKLAIDIAGQVHIPFAVRKGWHRYILPFNIQTAGSGIIVADWSSASSLIAGYKIEKGQTSSPYLRKDGTLVKAPEILLGGVVKALLATLHLVRGGLV